MTFIINADIINNWKLVSSATGKRKWTGEEIKLKDAPRFIPLLRFAIWCEMVTKDLSSNADGGRILLIGDIGRAFLDADAIRELPCEVHADMVEAIEAAANGVFAAIGVVMSPPDKSGSGSSPRSFGAALKALRESNRDAKIVLLAQMYEEPAAIQLVRTTSNGLGLADDYLICPLRTRPFYESVIAKDIGVRPKTMPAPVREQQPVRTVAAAVVDKSEERIKQLEKLATEDDLTGLKNRRYIWEFSRQVIERARRENERVTLLVFDIDNFKHYNDVYGHSAGDKVLKQAAVLMRRCCRGHDVVGRIGGDEFAVVFWDDPQRKAFKEETERRSASADHPKEAIFVAKRFRKELEKTELHLLGPEGKGVLTISGGLASFPRDGSTMQELFHQADKALLEAKRSGKNRIYLVGKPQNDIASVE